MLSLVNYSHFSLGYGSLLVDEIVKNAAQQKEKVAALTDVNTLAGIPDFMSACEKAGVKGIPGITLRLSENNEYVGDIALLARSPAAFNELKRVVSLFPSISGQTDNYHLTDVEVLKSLKVDGLDVIDGFPGSYLSQKHKSEQDLYEVFKHFRGQYRCVMSPTMDSSVVRSFVKSLGPEDVGSFVVSSMAAYQSPVDASVAMQRLQAHSEKDVELSDKEVKAKLSSMYYPEREMVKLWAKQDSMVEWAIGRGACVDSAVYENAASVFQVYHEPVIHPLVATDDFNEMIKEKWNDFVKENNLTQEQISVYGARLREEVDVINGVDGFGHYFTNTSRLINLFKDNDIDVSLRGSGAGSFVVYLLGASKVDPVEHKLSFKRFLSSERSDPPDLDLDITDLKKCHELMVEAYGESTVANLLSFGTIKSGKALFRESYDALIKFDARAGGGNRKILDATYERIKKAFDSLRGYDAKRTFEEQMELPAIKRALRSDGADLMVNMAVRNKLLKKTKEYSTGSVILNPAGVVESFSAVQPKASDGLWCSELTKTAVGYGGEIKYDVLSLPVLNKLALVKEREGLKFSQKVDIHDPNIYRVINNGALEFLFHINTFGGRETVSGIQPQSFKELMACIAVMRCSDRKDPELEFQKYIKGKNQGPQYSTPLLASVLDDTYGALIYEEQLLELCTDVAGIDYTSADMLRSAIKKKKADVIEKQKPQFIKSLMDKQGVPSQDAELVYAAIEEKYGTYLMGKSHCAAYCYIICEQAHMKLNFPMSYTSVHLDGVAAKNRDEKAKALIAEYQGMNIRFTKVDALRSGIRTQESVTPEGIKVISPGLDTLLDGEMCRSILASRKSAESGFVAFVSKFTEEVAGRSLPTLSAESIKSDLLKASDALVKLANKGGLDSLIPDEVVNNGNRLEIRKDVCANIPTLVQEIAGAGDHMVALIVKEDKQRSPSIK